MALVGGVGEHSELNVAMGPTQAPNSAKETPSIRAHPPSPPPSPASVCVLAFCGALQVGVVVSIVHLTGRTPKQWFRQQMRRLAPLVKRIILSRLFSAVLQTVSVTFNNNIKLE